MNNEEKILALLESMNGRMEKLEAGQAEMRKDINEMKKDLSELKSAHEITRNGVNTLLEWADDVACVVKVPFPKST